MATEAGYIVDTSNIADHEMVHRPLSAPLTYRQMVSGTAEYIPPSGGDGDGGTVGYAYVG